MHDEKDNALGDPRIPSTIEACMNAKIRANAFAAFGILSNFGVGEQREAFLEQIHGAFPHVILHLYDDDLSVRQACRNTLKRIAPLMEMEGLIGLFNLHGFSSDHRGDYEGFLRDLSRLLLLHASSRVDNCVASTIQAFEAPWPTIQANAVYFSSSMVSFSDDQRILAMYYTQVFGMLVSKMSRSTEAIVRATCSSSLGLLLKSTNSASWRTATLDRVDSYC